MCPAGTVCAGPNKLNCTVGTRGSRCEQCDIGYIGNTVTGCKPYCSSDCSGNGFCLAPDVCSCKPGWTGSLCETCIQGFEYRCYRTTTVEPTCFPTCSPYGGYCSKLGICTCYSGYEGLTCDRRAISSTTPKIVRATTTTTTQRLPTTTELIRCKPRHVFGIASSQLYFRYLLSPYQVNFHVLSTIADEATLERQSLEDFMNRALREELNRFTDWSNRFMRLAIVNVWYVLLNRFLSVIFISIPFL